MCIDYVLLLSLFRELWSNNVHRQWACDSDFNLPLPTNVPQRIMFIWWHNVELYAIHRCDRENAVLAVTEPWTVFESSQLLLVPSPSVFNFYLNIILWNSGNERHTWRISVSSCIVCSSLYPFPTRYKIIFHYKISWQFGCTRWVWLCSSIKIRY